MKKSRRACTDPLKVEIRQRKLVVSIGIDTLAHAIQFAPSLTRYEGDAVLYPKITDARKFATELMRALNREEEDGSTRVHRMLDEAAAEAIDQGAEGIELP